MPKLNNIDMCLGRLNFSPTLLSNSLDEVLDEVKSILMDPPEPIEFLYYGESFLWHFKYIETLTSEEYGEIIIGYLNKLRDDKFTQYSKNHNDYVENDVDNHLVEKSIFAIHIKSELIFFEKRPGISVNLFSKAFVHIIDMSSYLIKSTLSTIKNRMSFIERIKSLDKITRAKFILVPSNPEEDPEIEIIDRALKKIKSSIAVLDIHGVKMVFDDTLLEQGAYSALKGNGSAVVTGIKDDAIQVIKSDSPEFIIGERVIFGEEEAILSVGRAFERYIKRFFHKEN